MKLEAAIEEYERRGYLHADCCGQSVELETKECPDCGVEIVDGYGSLAVAVGL